MCVRASVILSSWRLHVLLLVLNYQIDYVTYQQEGKTNEIDINLILLSYFMT